MRDDTHPVDAAPLGACTGPTNRVRIPCVGPTYHVRIQIYTASLPMGREFQEAELVCTPTARKVMNDFALALATDARRPARAGQPLTPDDLLGAMIEALVDGGMSIDDIIGAACVEEEVRDGV